jgi:hypothetical protein
MQIAATINFLLYCFGASELPCKVTEALASCDKQERAGLTQPFVKLIGCSLYQASVTRILHELTPQKGFYLSISINQIQRKTY